MPRPEQDFFSLEHDRQMEAIAIIRKLQGKIIYSDKYCDSTFEYRHVILPKDLTKLVPRKRLMSEMEWRQLGVQQSPGWVHYMIHAPEPHVLLFRRQKGTSM